MPNSETDSITPISKRSFGTMPDGKDVSAYTLRNSNGMEVEILTYGGTITRLLAPDSDNKMADVVLGFDNLDDYRTKSPYFCCLVGRFGNRIANGKFTLNNKTYQLQNNDAPGEIPCSLHGGHVGFDKCLWQATPLSETTRQGLRLTYNSPDGEGGYPGNMIVTVHYWLTNENALRIQYSASSDQDTIVNLTQHNYYNLTGEGSSTINQHQLQLHAEHITPVDGGLIATGEIRPVSGTPFDFTSPEEIGSRVNSEDAQLTYANGYDHNWALDNQDGSFAKAGELYDPSSGRVMEVWTTEPGIQFYGGNFLDSTLKGKSGQKYHHRSGLCLETQHYPNSPNHENFPSTMLSAGSTYNSVTEYRFGSR